MIRLLDVLIDILSSIDHNMEVFYHFYLQINQDKEKIELEQYLHGILLFPVFTDINEEFAEALHLF